VLAIYFVRWESLPFGTITVGALLAAGYCTAVFFAGVIFTETLRRCKEKSRCFGSNIVGAVAGGLAQNASFVIGMKALLLLTAVFYLFAAVFAALSKYRAATAAASRPAASRNRIHEFLGQNG
jgi:high-affinity nickel permease